MGFQQRPARPVKQSVTRRGSQRGQSLVETAIACMVLVPMFFGVMLLGQYMHLRQQTQAAARSAAWDATVSQTLVNGTGNLPSASIEQDRIRALQFGKVDTSLRNVTAPTTLQDPMLTTFAGRNLVLARQVNLSTYTNEKSPAVSETFLGPISKITGAVGLGSFPPDEDGLVTAQVHVQPEHITTTSGSAATFMDPLDKLDLDFYGRTVVLADAWNADGSGENSDGSAGSTLPRTVRSAIKPLTPADWAGKTFDGGINGFVHLLGDIPGIDDLITPGFDKLEIGKTAPDVIPSDKLVRYGRVRP